MRMIYTIGYEKLTIDTFFKVLTDAKVDLIIDVRQLPLSRKRGFSKTALAQACAEHQIGYEHWQELGCPKTVRKDYRATNDWAKYTDDYLNHLKTIKPTLERLTQKALTQRCCLLCFEADVTTCHRLYISQSIAMDGRITVSHLCQK